MCPHRRYRRDSRQRRVLQRRTNPLVSWKEERCPQQPTVGQPVPRQLEQPSDDQEEPFRRENSLDPQSLPASHASSSPPHPPHQCLPPRLHWLIHRLCPFLLSSLPIPSSGGDSSQTNSQYNGAKLLTFEGSLSVINIIDEDFFLVGRSQQQETYPWDRRVLFCI